MKSKLSVLVLVVVLTVLAATPIAAAPMASPCTPGASYNPACDVNQDGAVNVLDIQLTAGHWNQSGTWLSDNSHNHLGQTWTGSNNPLKIQGAFGAPDYTPLLTSNSTGHGLAVTSAAIDGIYVGTAGYYGLAVQHADKDGVLVVTAGSPSSNLASNLSNGFEVAGAQGFGLYVGRADGNGVHVSSAGNHGVEVSFAAANGVEVFSVGGDALFVNAAGSDGVDVAGNGYAGYFAGNIFVTGNCIGCLQANFGVNAGDHALQPGDVVSIQAVTATDFDTGPALWQVTAVRPGQTIVGVVAGRAELVTQEDHRPTETGKRLVSRNGVVQPGEYVTIVYSGPMQVKATVPIAAGEKLTVDDNGNARRLRKTEVNGVPVAEDAPVLGIALSESQDGLVWVLVNPQ